MTYNRLEDAAGFCERLRAALGNHPFEFGKDPIRITAAFGVCAFQPGTHDTPREFVDDAIRALEKAKAEGGNKIEIA
jgi:GGDEF domain-containing protein